MTAAAAELVQAPARVVTPARAPGYSVRPRPPQDARDGLIAFWRDNLPIKGSVEEKFAWCYERAPVSAPAVLLLDADAGDGRPYLVGSAGYGLRRFRVPAQPEVVAAVMADLAVDRAHRTLRPALQLTRAARTHVLERAAFAYGYPNEHAEGVFKRAGYRVLGRTQRYVRVLRHTSYVRRVLRVPLAPRLIGVGLDVVRTVTPALRTMRTATRFRAEWPARIDHRFDHLWDATRDAYPVAARRDAAFLRWRFHDNPAGRCELVALVDRRAPGRPVLAYAALERQGDTVHLRDLFGHPEVLESLLDAVILGLRARGVAALSFRFLPARRLLTLMDRLGFSPRPAEPGRAVCLDAGTCSGLPEDPDAWWLTDFDEDT